MLIQQYSRTYWVDDDGYAVLGTGTADDGLGSGITSTYMGQGGLAGQTSAGYAYTLDSGDTISCRPTASYTGKFGGCGVDYSAVPIPITISLGGAVQDSSGNWDILVGQQCNASTNAPSAFPSGTTFTYQWSVSGTTFQQWLPYIPPTNTTPGNYLASYYVGGSGTLTNPTASWYWNDAQQATETVSCTVTPTLPPGYPAVGPFTVTKQVKVYLPTISDDYGTGANISVFIPGDYAHYANMANNGDYWLMAGGATYGMTWQAAASAPANTPFAGGTLELCQIWARNANWTTVAGASGSTIYSAGLDNQFPLYRLTGNPYSTNDNPGVDLTGIATVSLGDTFNDYLMYMVPGSIQPVPVATFNWSCTDFASVLGGDWLDYTPSSVPVNPSGVTPFVLGNAWPSWTNVNSNTN